MLIKILEIRGQNYCDDCNSSEIDYGITDWDEVTEEQFQQITDWATKTNYTGTRNKCYYIVTVYKPEEKIIPTTIAEYLKMIEDDEKKEEKRLHKKREAKLEREKKKASQEKDELEKLLKKHGMPTNHGSPGGKVIG